jgi:hypothetical protein
MMSVADMKHSQGERIIQKIVIGFLLVALATSACQGILDIPSEPTPVAPGGEPATVVPSSSLTATPLTNPDGTVAVRFQVTIPEPLAAGDIIYLVVLDELTGLPYNQQRYAMTAEGERALTYSLNLPAGTTVLYRYLRLSAQVYMTEALKNGEVQARTTWAGANNSIVDRVFCWSGEGCDGAVGRIAGVVTNETGKPQAGIWVFAGGTQDVSAADGSYLLEDVPSGQQNLVAMASDGRAFVFQQGALVNAESLTPANIMVQTLPLVEVIFLVSTPVDTPQDAVLRIAGNIAQLGNVFASLDGGLRISPAMMPVMARLEDGRYFYRAILPAGAEIRYRYTLGDGLWNSEHTASGAFVQRRVLISDHNLELQDTVETWRYGAAASLDLFVHVPAITPASEIVAVQFDPGLGWMEPLAMWPAGENLWHLTLYSPLVGISKIQYRYCRNLQCDSGAEIREIQRVMVPSANPQIIEDTVNGWQFWHGPGDPAVVPSIEIGPRNDRFMAGIGWAGQGFDPNWIRGFPGAAAETAGLKAGWLLLQPTWTVDPDGAPRLAYNPSTDFEGDALRLAMGEARVQNLRLALFPGVNFSNTGYSQPSDWWQAAPRTFPWWLSWFESYRRYILSFASLAEEQRVEALVIGGDWLLPTFKWAILPDGTLSGSPGDANERWQALIADIRTRYHGPLYWAVSYRGQRIEVPVLAEDVDGLLVLWSEGLSTIPSYDANSMAAVAGALMDVHIRPLRVATGKPVILAMSYPAARGASSGCVIAGVGLCASAAELLPGAQGNAQIVEDLLEQEAVFNAFFAALSSRDWIDGVFVMDFHPGGPVQDLSASVYAKPASGVVWYWFGKFLGK